MKEKLLKLGFKESESNCITFYKILKTFSFTTLAYIYNNDNIWYYVNKDGDKIEVDEKYLEFCENN